MLAALHATGFPHAHLSDVPAIAAVVVLAYGASVLLAYCIADKHPQEGP